MTAPDEPATQHDDAAGNDDEVTRLQRDMDVANDSAHTGGRNEEEPPGDPAG